MSNRRPVWPACNFALRRTLTVKAKRAGLDALGIASRTGDLLKSVDDVLRKRYLPHDGEVASNATAPGKYAGNESLTFRPKLLQIQENHWGIV
jgi:hypothetical protein